MVFWSSAIRNEEKYLQLISPNLEITGKYIVLEKVALTHCSERKIAERAITVIHGRQHCYAAIQELKQQSQSNQAALKIEIVVKLRKH